MNEQIINNFSNVYINLLKNGAYKKKDIPDFMLKKIEEKLKQEGLTLENF